MPTGITNDILFTQPLSNGYTNTMGYTPPVKPLVPATNFSDDIVKFAHTKVNPMTQKVPLLGQMETYFKGVNSNLIKAAENYAAKPVAQLTLKERLAGNFAKGYAWIRTHNPFYEFKNLVLKKGYTTKLVTNELGETVAEKAVANNIWGKMATSGAKAGESLSKVPALSKLGKILGNPAKIPVIGNVILGAVDVGKGIFNAIKSLAQGEVTDAFKHFTGGIVKGGLQLGVGVLLSTPIARLGSLAGFLVGSAGVVGAEWLGNKVNKFLGLEVKPKNPAQMTKTQQQQLQQLQGQMPQQQFMNNPTSTLPGADNPYAQTFGMPTYGLPPQLAQQYGFPQNPAFNSLANNFNTPFYNQQYASISNGQVPNPNNALRDAFQAIQSVENSYFNQAL